MGRDWPITITIKIYVFKPKNIDKVYNKEIFFPLNKTFKKYAGDFYSPFKIKKILEELDELIEKNNLQFVEHNVQESIENDSINVVLNVFEGEKTLVERINIIGNNITNEEVIFSWLKLITHMTNFYITYF